MKQIPEFRPISLLFSNLKLIRFLCLFALTGSMFLSNRAKGQSIYFPPTSGNQWDTISPSSMNWCQERIDSLYSFLDTNDTKAFILLKNGKIVLEHYFGTFTQNDFWYWASAGKTITSFLTGIAQQNGLLSINDTTSNYLGSGWTSCTLTQEQKITVRNQLTMTSGLDDGVADSYCTNDTCLVYLADAGSRWAYHNAPYTLLDSVIRVATGVSLNNYTSQNLLIQTGMSGAFFQSGFNNVFVSDARSMARFGLLILNRGNWNGNNIMTDSVFFNEMVNTSQSLNPSYGYLWWLNGKSSYMLPQSQFVFNGPLNNNAPSDMIAAIGKNGQFINVIPSQNMVWIRMGDSPSSVDVPFLLNNDIWAKINQLSCPASTNYPEKNEHIIANWNHSNETFEVHSDTEEIKHLALFDIGGRIISQFCFSEKNISIPLPGIKCGIYFLKLILVSGKQITSRVVVIR